MRKKVIIVLVVLAAIVAYVFRNDLLFQFQYARLDALSCDSESEGIQMDTCLNKIWAHRVNSLERFKKIENKFFGYEVDIVWDGKRKQFLVYHPPLGKETPLTLDSFFSVANPDKTSFWLDLRETNPADTAAIRAAFDKIDQGTRLKLSTIIEVYDTAVANHLANNGYWVSLNINTEWIQKFSRESQWEQLRRSMSPMISFVSQEDVHIPVLKKQFPGKDIITWSLAFENYIDRKHLKKLVMDDRVKVVLVNVKSDHYK